MYEAYFHLQKRPFTATPDPTCFFAPEPVQEVLDELILRTENGQGIGLVSSPAGTGKTLLCRRLALELSPRFTPIFLPNANLPTRRALLQSILFELGRRYSRMEEQELRLAVYRALRDLSLAGRGAVVIVDEAHLLSDRLLEELRMLASLSEQDEPLARLILAGQLPLEERLIDPALEALNQRVVCHRYLEPLTRIESIDYVCYRIGWAGGGDSEIFTPEALERIAVACNGLPRCINHLCDHALLLAYVHEQRRVSAELVEGALEDLKQLPLLWNTPLTDDEIGATEDEQGDELTLGEDLPLPAELVPSGENMVDSASIEIGGADTADEIVNEMDTDCDLGLRGDQDLGEQYYAADLWEDAEPRLAHDHYATQAPLRGAVPLAEPAEASLRGFVDEIVDDRYAALDRSAPRILRTFDDSVVPENLRLATDQNMPGTPEPPSTHDLPLGRTIASAAAGAQSPDQTVDEMIALINQARSAETTSAVPDMDSATAGSCQQFDAIDAVAPERQAIEEQIGSSILDACLEVQTTLGRWDEAHLLPGGEQSEAYDIVEPDLGRKLPETGPHQHRPSGEREAADRYVPKPKYRHVFSTLRRRLGLRREL